MRFSRLVLFFLAVSAASQVGSAQAGKFKSWVDIDLPNYRLVLYHPLQQPLPNAKLMYNKVQVDKDELATMEESVAYASYYGNGCFTRLYDTSVTWVPGRLEKIRNHDGVYDDSLRFVAIYLKDSTHLRPREINTYGSSTGYSGSRMASWIRLLPLDDSEPNVPYGDFRQKTMNSGEQWQVFIAFDWFDPDMVTGVQFVRPSGGQPQADLGVAHH